LINKIKYFEEGGMLRFSYEEKVSVPTCNNATRRYEFSAPVPEKVQKEGEQAVKDYAEQEVENYLEVEKEKDKEHDKFAENPDFSISITHDRVELKGGIFSAINNTISVRLEEPYQGESSTRYGMATAMSKRFIFDSKSNGFSQDAIESAKKLLIDIYEEGKHREENAEVIKLADSLNE
jgi:hypothetical protein